MQKKLLDILVCPQCKSGMIWREQAQELLCEQCRLAYPVHDDIPVLLVDEARAVNPEELNQSL